MAIEKPNQYYDDSLIDPDSDDIEIDIPDEFDEDVEFGSDNIEYLEDGSVVVGDVDQDENAIDISTIPHGDNLVSLFDDDELSELSGDLITAWEQDNEDRSEWKETYEKGLDLLGMKIEERDEPFAGASGVNHPLLAEAVVQFQAQAYKELLPAGGPVLTKVLGDETPDRLAQAARVQDYLNYQIVAVMDEYDSDMDQLLLYLPLGGSAFKKTYFDPIKNRSCSSFVTAEHVTVPNNAKNLTSCPRIIHDFYLDGNSLLKHQDSNFYANTHMAEHIELRKSTSGDVKAKELHGVEINSSNFESDEEYLILECHVELDHEILNDGSIVRPYILTLDYESGTVLAIRRNWQENDPLKQATAYFTHYKFLPGLGFYGFGLIHMIGGLTTSATAILRQLIDAGTFSNLPGGLKAKGMRVAGDDEPIAPGEWRDVDVAGGTIRDSLMPLPYKEPSNVLFQLMGSLVDAGQRFASIADMNVGDVSSSQGQPVGTTIAMLERGTKVMSAIHKRLHNSQKHEFKILARIVKENLPADGQYPYAVQGSDKAIMAQDFDDRIDVLPVSDPNIFSMAQRVMLASQQLQMAQAAPKVHNIREAYRRMYVAMGISDVETILIPEKKPQNMTPIMEHRKVLQNSKLEAVKGMDHMIHIQAHLTLLKHPVVSNNIEFVSNLIQDIMGHIGFLAIEQATIQQQQQQQAAQQGLMPQQPQAPQQANQPPPGTAAIELELLTALMPQLMPPQPTDPMVELQKRQLDITERYNDGKISIDELQAHNKKLVDMLAIASKEKIAEAQNQINIEDTILNARVKLSQKAAELDDRSQGSQNT
tara:strand:+ start:5516 stop:7972 length:2457 start_codon:yes stop_codon:yes gene_type:complete